MDHTKEIDSLINSIDNPLFHGTYIEFNSIDLGKCKEGCDFGKGFYVTEVVSQALDWASKNAKKNKCKVAYVKIYNLVKEIYYKLRIKEFSEINFEWLVFIINARQKKIQPDYDAVAGPVAGGNISNKYEKVNNDNNLKKIGLDKVTMLYEQGIDIEFCVEQFKSDFINYQIVFLTNEALKSLEFKGNYDFLP